MSSSRQAIAAAILSLFTIHLSLLGFMPRNRRFGFITQAQFNGRTIAHELGHGAFNLRHTFSADGWNIPNATTDNLMDYNEGSRLIKPQWDLIHNPELTTGLLDDESEGASIGTYYLQPNGKPIKLPSSITKLCFVEDNIKCPRGSLKGFIDNQGVSYSLAISPPQSSGAEYIAFYGYRDKNNNYYNKDKTIYNEGVTIKVRKGFNIVGLNNECLTSIEEGDYKITKTYPNSTVDDAEINNFYSNSISVVKNQPCTGCNAVSVIHNTTFNCKDTYSVTVSYDEKSKKWDASFKLLGKPANDAVGKQKAQIEKQVNDLLDEKLNELGGLDGTKTDAVTQTTEEDGGEFYVKDMNGREWLETLCNLGSNVWENASLPEKYWKKVGSKEGYNNSTIHLPPMLSGVSDGAINVVSDYPQLIKLGYDVATKEEVRDGIWNAIKNITPSSFLSMATDAVKTKIDNYNFSDKPYLGYHEMGKDGVTVVSMVVGASFIHGGEDALEKTVKETGEKIGKKVFKNIEEFVVDVIGKRGKIRGNIISLTETKNYARLFANKIGVKDLEFEDWFTNTFKKYETNTLNFEAHHVIPIDVLNTNDKLKELLYWAEQNGKNFDFNGIDNGMMIQKKDLLRDVSGHTIHNKYNDAISEKITQIIQGAGDDNAKAFVQVKKFITDTKTKLKDEVLLGNKNVDDIVNF